MSKLDELVAYLEPLAWMSARFKNDLIQRFIVAIEDAHRRGESCTGRRPPKEADFTRHENHVGDREIRVRGLVIAGRRAEGMVWIANNGGRSAEFTRTFNMLWESCWKSPVLNWDGTQTRQS